MHRMEPSVHDQFHMVRGRPLPKEPLNFYQFKQGNRFFLNLTDSPAMWKEDLIIGERLFSDIVICSTEATHQENMDELTRVQDILKQRMKYPGAREDAAIEAIAKTWVLPNKLHFGPLVEQLIGAHEFAFRNNLEEIITKLNVIDSIIHFLKIELSNGLERQVVYKLLDNGFRPSLILVKWGQDLDDHLPTAHCAGHLMNSGYSLVMFENGYALYMFVDHTLYDTCSMKTVALENPFFDSITQTVLQSVREHNKSMVAKNVVPAPNEVSTNTE
jgi:hypothetical protein